MARLLAAPRADIYLPASEGRPEIVMPPLSPPPECADHLEIRTDDTEEVVRKRLQVSPGVRAGLTS
jgi:adenylate kinase